MFTSGAWMTMDGGGGDTGALIRTLARRQLLASLAVVALVAGSMVLGWQSIDDHDQSAATINLAGRQRMLSQRMVMFLVLQERERDVYQRRYYLDAAAAATAEFETAHERLVAAAASKVPGGAIHALYFDADGGVDARSRRFAAQVREAIAGTRSGHPANAAVLAAITVAADAMLTDLNEAVIRFERDADDFLRQLLILLQVSAALVVALVAFVRYRVVAPAARRLAADVAARDRAQAELADSEERFKAFSESLSDWFWQTDAEDRFTWFQDGKDAQAPIDHASVIGHRRMEFLPPVELAATEKWARYQADIAARRPFRDLEYQVGGSGRVLRWISVSGRPYFDADGNFLGYRGTARNIQAQKEADAHRRRLLLAIEQSPVAIAFSDMRGNLLYINAHYSRVTGYGSEEVIGQTQAVVRAGLGQAEAYAEMDKVLAQGRVWRGELRGRRKNGEIYWEDLSISPVVDQLGRTTSYVAVSEDVTEKKRLAGRDAARGRILEAIAGGLPLAGVLELMVAMTEAELPGATCDILRLDAERGTLHHACASHLPPACAAAVEGMAIGPGVGACGTAAFTGARVVVADIAGHPDFDAWRPLVAAHGLHACWSQPIISSTGTVLGTVACYFREIREPDADATHLLETVASLAAICLERDAAECQLRRQEAEARRLLVEHETILSNAVVGIVYLRHRRIVSCNRRFEQIFGCAPGELIGESTLHLFDTPESFEAIGAEAYRVVAEGRNYSTELMLKRRDGTRFRGALNGCALDPAQPQEGSIWVYADISERHRAEQEARKLLRAVEQSPVSIVITSREGTIEYVNPRFTRVSGYSAAEALGQNPRILQSGETPAETYRELWQTLLAGREWHGILRNRRKNGELFWEEATMSPILDENGVATHFLAVKEDITERKRIEDELDRQRTHLEEVVARRTADLRSALEASRVADRAKDAFLAHVSHELRTPLNAVIGLSDLARRIASDPRQRDYLDKVAGAGKTLSGIINDLLDLSKISAGRMDLEVIPFKLRNLVARGRSVMAHRAEEKGLTLVERIDDAVPDALRGDPLRIEQILLNLMSNAIKFTAAGRVELRIGTEYRDGPRIGLLIEVEDTGIGLAPAAMAKLFQPFTQADASMNRKFGGTGLGLALCKRLAELMDGSISVASREGVGSTFTVRLRVEVGDPASQAHTPLDPERQALPSSYRGARVLVADDQPLNREIVTALMAEVGIATDTVGNGREAIKVLEAAGPGAFDLVLMDIQMPVLDGLAATREIRRRGDFAGLPIVAMTAHIMEHEKELGLQAGMNDHLGKPFETEDFFRLLARWIPAEKHGPPAATAAHGPGAATVAAAPPAAAAPPEPAPTGLAALPEIDIAAGLARFSGNEQRYRHWLAEFARQATGETAEIAARIAAADLDGARRLAHALKGRSGNLGMSGLQAIAAELEAALAQGALRDDVLRRLQETVERLSRDICRALDATPDAQNGGTPS